MKNQTNIFSRLVFFSLIHTLLLVSFGAQADEPVVLFDGKNLNEWNTIGDANWEINGDVVEADQGRGMLVSKKSYTDFTVTLEFWTDEPANSGVFIRCSDSQNVTAVNSYEVNIFDTRPDQTYRTGAIVGVAPPKSKIDAKGQWNNFEITAQGNQLIVVLNGIETVNVKDDKFAAGPIALQYGAGVVKFRNVRIREL